jgi:hypothetical protein
VRKVVASSTSKRVHIIHVRHRDEVEAPITDWLQEAYEFNVAARPARASRRQARGRPAAARKASPATRPSKKTRGRRKRRRAR